VEKSCFAVIAPGDFSTSLEMTPGVALEMTMGGMLDTTMGVALESMSRLAGRGRRTNDQDIRLH
jgi:hypothetical protein